MSSHELVPYPPPYFHALADSRITSPHRTRSPQGTWKRPYPGDGDPGVIHRVRALGFGFDGRRASGGVGFEHAVWGHHGLDRGCFEFGSRKGDVWAWGDQFVYRERWG